MNKPAFTAFFFLFLSIVAPPVSFGAENESPAAHQDALSALSANRSLLIEAELEYVKLKQDYAENPFSEVMFKKIEGVKVKIKLLNEDSVRLQPILNQQERAKEFMKDLLLTKSLEGYSKRFPSSPPPQTAVNALPLPVTETLAQKHERALRYVASQELEKASKLYEEIVLDDPNDDQAYVIMGHTYLLTGKYEKAEDAFKNAVQIDPANANEITPFYQNIIIQNPNDDVAFNNLGYAYFIVGDYLKSRDAFLQSLELNPDNAAAQDGMKALENIE